MAAQQRRALVKVRLHIDQPWAVGAVSTYDVTRPRRRTNADDEPTIYLPIQKDPRDNTPVLPATSLVGSLRAHLTNPQRWLGDPDSPSPVRALGTVIEHDQSVGVRTSTAIDGSRRAAATHTLRAEELVEPLTGSTTVVSWWLQLDYDRDVADLDDLTQQLLHWTPIIGRRRGVGRGHAVVVGVDTAVIDLHTVPGLTWWLSERSGWLTGSPTAQKPPGWVRAVTSTPDDATPPTAPNALTWQFTVVDPLHLGVARTSELTGHQGAVTHTGTVVPGSSWRGLFRHRVAHVVRMRGGDDDTVAATLSRLFGSGRTTGNSTSGGHRGQLSFDDSPVRLAGSLQVFTHVAIDRVTGGARQFSENLDDDTGQGALFKIQAIPPGSSTQLRIRWTGHLDDDDRSLLAAVVTDLDDGLIGVGGLTSRGYGTLRLNDGPEIGTP